MHRYLHVSISRLIQLYIHVYVYHLFRHRVIEMSAGTYVRQQTIFIYTYIQMYVYVNLFTHACICIYAHPLYIYIYIYVYIYIYIEAHTRKMNTYTYAYICTYTYMHIYDIHFCQFSDRYMHIILGSDCIGSRTYSVCRLYCNHFSSTTQAAARRKGSWLEDSRHNVL